MNDSGSIEISHEGVVANNSGKSVTVTISAKSACSGCHAKGSCSLIGSGEKTVEVEGAWSVRPGDAVNVVMKQSMGFTALFYGYILPFLTLMTVLIVSLSAGFTELASGTISIAALLPYFLVLWIFRKRLNGKFAFSLKV